LEVPIGWALNLKGLFLNGRENFPHSQFKEGKNFIWGPLNFEGYYEGGFGEKLPKG